MGRCDTVSYFYGQVTGVMPRSDLLDTLDRMTEDDFPRPRGISSRHMHQIASAVVLFSIASVSVMTILVPDTRRGWVAVGIVEYTLLQLWFLARSKTISWRLFAWALRLGMLTALISAALEVGIARIAGMGLGDAAAGVWMAGPVEELLKLSPLLVMIALSPHAVRRLSIVDLGLLGMAFGGGFQIAEDVVRRVTTSPSGFSIFPSDSTDLSSTQFRVWSLFPGWSELPTEGAQSAHWPSHLLTTGLVAIAIGVALRLSPRLGMFVYFLPAALFALSVLDHLHIIRMRMIRRQASRFPTGF